MQLREGPDAHPPVTGIFADVFGGGFGPGARIIALHLRPVTPRPSSASRWAKEARLIVETTSRTQTEEDPARISPEESLLQLHGIVAGIEDEQWHIFYEQGSSEQLSDLCCVATMFVSCSGRTRLASNGAVQLSRTKPSCA